MGNLSVIREVKVEAIARDHTAIVSTDTFVSFVCTSCGGLKSVIAYVGNKKAPVFTAGSPWPAIASTCRCQFQNAPNSGGGPVDETGMLEFEQRQLLSDLYKYRSVEEMRLAIPITPARQKYEPEFRDILDRLYIAKNIIDARSIIELYRVREPEGKWSV